MPPITISNGVILIPERAGVDAEHPPRPEKVVRLLAAAKGNTLVMSQLRSLIPTTTPLKDQQILDAIAAAIAQRRMQIKVLGVCTPAKKRFFDWLAVPLSTMAKELDTTPQIMLTLGVKEGGWRTEDLDHNQPLNNPFGLNHINKEGQASGNKKYATLQDCIDEWKKPRAYVKGVKDAQKFVDLLLAHGYNTNKTAYSTAFMEDYTSVGKAMDACGISKDLPK